MKDGYTITIQGFDETYKELESLYKQHYKEMTDRLESLGIFSSPYNPRLETYSHASKVGGLLTFVLKFEGKAVGYSNVYLANDMHNNDLIAQEDTIYVTPEHRNGIGRELVKYALRELSDRGVKRVLVTAATDLRAEKMWSRMGFKPSAHQMTYVF